MPRRRHAGFVRATHWLTTLAFTALLVSGVEVLLSHPRFYWGETGNVNETPLFTVPVPASRSTVPTGYGYVLPDQNGWSRYLHFQSAWLLGLTGLAYLLAGLSSGHLRRNLVPASADLRWPSVGRAIGEHLRLSRASAGDPWSYNPLQRVAYLFVIFVLAPFVIWTGLAMAPGFAAMWPATGDAPRWTAIGADPAFRRVGGLHPVPVRAPRDARPRRFHGTRACDDHRPRGGPPMSPLSRRMLLTAGLAAVGTSVAAAAATLGRRFGLVPPDSGGIYGAGETLTYAAHRLVGRHAMAREFPRHMISAAPFANSVRRRDEAFLHHQAAGFATWRLAVDGLVARPASLSLAELRGMPVAAKSPKSSAKKAGLYIAEWMGRHLRPCSRRRASAPRRATWCTSRMTTTRGTASISTKRGTRRRSSRGG